MATPVTAASWSFERVYEAQFAFAWRNARRLGVDAAHLDDVLQEVFMVVHRRLPEVADRPDLRGWVLSIVFGVVKNHRRALRRRGNDDRELNPGSVPSDEVGPEENAARAEATLALYTILSELDDDKRMVFVLAELELLSAPEIAEATTTNVNTVYARLRAARKAFNAGVARYRLRDGWRMQ